MRILLVHSEPLTADVLAAMLRHQGYDVVQAATTQEAVLRSARHEADIVFLDLRASQTSAVAETVALLCDADPALFIICAVDGDAEASTPGVICLRRPYSVCAVAELFQQTARLATLLYGEPPQPAVLKADGHTPPDAADLALLCRASCPGPGYPAALIPGVTVTLGRHSRAVLASGT
jgi:CheY-like chemotaxis protein